jgi:membrane protease YdiL (CAAX protease family)
MNINLIITSIFGLMTLVLFVLEKSNKVKSGIYIPFFISTIIFIYQFGLSTVYATIVKISGLSDNAANLLFYDWGNGLLGFLPLCLGLYYLGKNVFNFSLNDQWGGNFIFTNSAVKWGLITVINLSAVTLGLAILLAHQKVNITVDVYRYAVNAFTNLYEEFICRGLLLAACLRYWNKITGWLFTLTVFALMHGVGDKAIFILLTSWTIAWSVTKAENLWAGWVAHQGVDMIVDTLIP